MKPMKMIALILCLAFSFQAQGFWIVGGNAVDDHGAITERALEDYFYTPRSEFFKEHLESQKFKQSYGFYYRKCKSDECSFYEKTIKNIAAFNADIDGGNTASDPNYHCDDERIVECGMIIRAAKEKVLYGLLDYIKNAKNGEIASEKDFSKLREIFGRSLHTLQDFYSHSNWVERSLYGKNKAIIRIDNSIKDKVVDVVKVTVNRDIFEKNYYVDISTDHTCVTGLEQEGDIESQYYDLYLNNLITGFYHENKEIYQSFSYCNIPNLLNEGGTICKVKVCTKQYVCYLDTVPLGYAEKLFSGGRRVPVPVTYDGQYFDSNYKEKCIHSSSPPDSLSLSKSIYTGLAKDHPAAAHHDVAVYIAEKATTEYLEYIIEKVINGNNDIYTDWAILRFLGYKVEINAPIYQNGLDTLNIKEEESITISARTAFEDVETQQADLMFSFEITEGSDIISISQNDAEVSITGTKVGQATILVTAIDEDEFVGTKSFEVEVERDPEALMLQDTEEEDIAWKPWLTQQNHVEKNYYDTSGNTASTYCLNLMLLGYDDWRLPTEGELSHFFYIGLSFQTSLRTPSYWTSNTNFRRISFGYGADSANTVHLYTGNISLNGIQKNSVRPVRCVRGGN